MGNKERIYADVMAINSEVTGSCNLVSVRLPIPDKKESTVMFVVDCGLFQEPKHNSLNEEKLPFRAEDVNFCLVTHNHVDHTGRLPYLVKNGYGKKIYATEATCKLLPYALKDSFKVLSENAKRNNGKCIYREQHVDETLELLVPCKYNEPVYVHPNIKVTFLTNGHLVGAALILVQIFYEGCETINLLFTGDYAPKNMFFDVQRIPKWILDLPITIIQESTYGSMDTTEIVKTFEKNILECVNNGGEALVMVFSLGRAQEIMYELRRMQKSGQLDLKIPIFIDGNLAIKYTNLYLNDDELNLRLDMREFLPLNYHFVDKAIREFVLFGRDNKIILTTSGMGSYGPAQTYIPEYIRRDNALIQFTGYTAEGTLGSYLKKAEIGDELEIGGMCVEKRAKVEYTTEYSAHAKADEMINFLSQFSNLKCVLLNHGEEKTKNVFKDRIIKELDPKNIEILDRDHYFRINPYGLSKAFYSKSR